MIFATATDTTILVIAILGAIALFLISIFIFYLIIASRRASITLKKVDYLVEDLTYKSQLMNSTVELTNKVSKYFDGLDFVFKGGIKSTMRILFGNKDTFQSYLEKIKEIFFVDNEESEIKNSDNKEQKTPERKSPKTHEGNSPRTPEAKSHKDSSEKKEDSNSENPLNNSEDK